MSALDGLPTCLTLQPAALIPAVRGAVGFRGPGAVEVARAVRDHRELIPRVFVVQLLAYIDGWLENAGRDAAALDRAPWIAAAKALRRPTLVEAATARRQAWLDREEPERRRAGAR